jgi:hypothetical protein
VAEDCIFSGPARVRQPDRGLISHSYLPAGSAPPRLVGCCGPGAVGLDPRAAAIRPQFTSTRFGDCAYGQLAGACRAEIAAGARLGREMGAFNGLGQPVRIARLLEVLDEMLPAGQTATITYRT